MFGKKKETSWAKFLIAPKIIFTKSCPPSPCKWFAPTIGYLDKWWLSSMVGANHLHLDGGQLLTNGGITSFGRCLVFFQHIRPDNSLKSPVWSPGSPLAMSCGLKVPPPTCNHCVHLECRPCPRIYSLCVCALKSPSLRFYTHCKLSFSIP